MDLSIGAYIAAEKAQKNGNQITRKGRLKTQQNGEKTTQKEIWRIEEGGRKKTKSAKKKGELNGLTKIGIK